MRIGDVCTTKVVSIRGDESLLDAAQRMRRFHVGDLVVTDANDPLPRPVGILTDRDIVVALVAQEIGGFESLRVEDVLIADTLIAVNQAADVSAAVDQMREHGIRRVPVVDDRGVLAGIFTLDDALAFLVSQLSAIASVAERQSRYERERRP